ncbi:MAG: TRAP transporter substrate-binding protein [Deferrisomatales bacterium]
MRDRKSLVSVAALVAVVVAAGGAAAAPPSPLDAYKPGFDPSGAKYVMKVSNVSHPSMACVSVGYRIRDELWKRTNGQIFLDYYPLSQLGGEVEVANQLLMGAVQGMMISSVTAATIGPRFGVVNLPFLVNTFDKLDRFAKNPELFEPFLAAADEKGLLGVGIGAYGGYGWATVKPVRSIADAKPLKFRTAEAPVNQSLYKAWGLNAVVMPWPDVQVALKQGVIDGLDHTASVSAMTKKFEAARHYTRLDYAQGLLITVLNKAWVQSLPKDLQKTLLEVIREEQAKTHELARQEEEREIAKATAEGVQFFRLPDAEMALLRKQGDVVHKEWAERIGPEYLKKVQAALGYAP